VRTRVEAKLARAEALSEAHRDREAVEAFREVRAETGALGSAELALRALAGEGWALQELGAAHEAIAVLQEARELTELPEFSDIDRADVLFRLGCCRYRISSIPSAIGLLDQALELAAGHRKLEVHALAAEGVPHVLHRHAHRSGLGDASRHKLHLYAVGRGFGRQHVGQNLQSAEGRAGQVERCATGGGGGVAGGRGGVTGGGVGWAAGACQRDAGSTSDGRRCAPAPWPKGG